MINKNRFEEILETTYINRDGKELSGDELYTSYARRNFAINHNGFVNWIDSRIENGSLTIKRG